MTYLWTDSCKARLTNVIDIAQGEGSGKNQRKCFNNKDQPQQFFVDNCGL